MAKKINISGAQVGAFFKEGKNWAIIAAVLIALYILGRFTGVFKSKDERDERKRDNLTEDDARKEATKQPLSFSLFQYNSWADAIHNALKFSGISDKPEVAEEILLRMKNDSDVAQLYLSYGKRQRYFFGLPDGGPEDLTTTINREFSNARKQRVNEAYRAKNIKFQF